MGSKDLVAWTYGQQGNGSGGDRPGVRWIGDLALGGLDQLPELPSIRTVRACHNSIEQGAP
jgi:hypothetical protein